MEELPNRVYGILVNEWIWANYGKPIDNGMTNQNSIEGIAVVSGQLFEEENIRIRKSIVDQLMHSNRFRNKFMGRNAKKKIPFIVFELNFKSCCLMNKKLVLGIAH